MQSIHLFNEEQIKDFKMICSDFSGPTMTEYVLGVMAALDYAETKRVLESK